MLNKMLLGLALLWSPPQAAEAQTGNPDSCPVGLELLVEGPFARSAGIRAGDQLRVRGSVEGESCEATVAGLFDPPPDPSRLTTDRPRVLFHLPQLTQLVGRVGEVDHFTIKLRTGTDPDAAIESLSPLLPGTQVLRMSEVADRSSTTFEVVSRFHRAIGIITLIAGGVFLACIMVLKVQERRKPVAAARLLGIPRRTLLGWTVVEAAVVSTLGGVLGLGLGVAASHIINAFYQRVYQTNLVFSHVTAVMVMQALFLAVVLGMVAGVFAGARLAASDPLAEIGR